MSLRHGLLGLLRHGETTGYDLNHYFQTSLAFFWSAQTSQIYRELTALEKDGMIQSRLVYQESRPNKKLYSITAQGEEELDHWLSQSTTKNAMDMRSPFLMQLFLSDLRHAPTVRKLLTDFGAQAQANLDALAPIQALIAQKPPDKLLMNRVVADFGMRTYEMYVQWAKDSLALLNKATETTPDEPPHTKDQL